MKEEIERLNNIIDKKEQFLGDNIKRLEREVVKRDNIINELEKDAKENIRIGKNKGYQYVSNLKELLTAEEIYDYISYNCGLYIIEQLDKLKELKGE